MESAQTHQTQSTALDLVQALNIPIAIWLLASTYILDFSLYYRATASNGTVAFSVIAMTIARLSVPPRIRWVSFGNVILGIWIAVSPFALGFTASTRGTINDVAVGIAIALIAAIGFLRR